MEQQNEHISNQQSAEMLTRAHNKPLGELALPAFTCGFVGAVLTITLAILGWFDGLNLDLKAYYIGKPFYMPETSVTWHFFWDVVVVVLLSFGVSFTVLDTDRQWRRVMIILLLTVVVLFSSPVLMLWDIFWSPVTVLVGVLWSWICAFIYSCQHTMPCELLLENNHQVSQQLDKSVEKDKPEETILTAENEDLSEDRFQPKESSTCPD